MAQITQAEFLTSDGLKLVADVGGPEGAPLVVLLHGGGQTRHSWSSALNGLVGAGYRVINFDARGHGDSDWSKDGNYGLEVRSRDLADVIGEHPGPVALVGASMGGMTSFYAVGQGLVPRVQALIMVDITLRPAAGGVDNIRRFMAGNVEGFASLDEAADAVAAYNPQRPRPSDPSGLMKNLRKQPNGRLRWHWDARMLEIPSSPDTPNWTDELIVVSERVKLPTLLIRGGQSDIVDDAGVEEMLALVPQTEVLTIAGAGHMVAGDRNDVFNSGVIGFLQRHVAAT
jgi:pimeloyl-ACP methyl ester carboxylesterase